MKPEGSALISSFTVSFPKFGIEPWTPFAVLPGMTVEALVRVSQYTMVPHLAETTSKPGSPVADLAVKVARGSGSASEVCRNDRGIAITSLDDGTDALE